VRGPNGGAIVGRPSHGALARVGIDRASTGTEVVQLVEEVDIYPSLLALAGLDVPTWLQGTSWVPLLQDKAEARTPPTSLLSQMEALRCWASVIL
jgi:hypothetical protein